MERNGSFIVFDRAHGAWVVASTTGRHSQRRRTDGSALGSRSPHDQQRAEVPADSGKGNAMAWKRLATSAMALTGRLILTVALSIVSVVTGFLAWYSPALLRAIPENDIQMTGLWVVGFLLLVIIAGCCLIAIFEVWHDHD